MSNIYMYIYTDIYIDTYSHIHIKQAGETISHSGLGQQGRSGDSPDPDCCLFIYVIVLYRLYLLFDSSDPDSDALAPSDP